MAGGEQPKQDFWADYSQQNQTGQEAGQDFATLGQGENPPQTKSGREKIITGLVLVICVAAVFLIYYQTKASFNGPLSAVFKISEDAANKNPAPEVKETLATILALKQKDTDNDGLSDYDEIYIYKTSPYLEDTDGDGFSDKKEIDGGHDPNCPGSDDCFSGGGTNVNGGQTAAGLPANQQEIIAQQQALSNQLLSGQASAEAIRVALIQGGIPQETLSQISDEEIMAFYHETMSGGAATAGGQANGLNNTSISQSDMAPLNGSNATNTSANSNINLSDLNVKSIDDLRNLSGAQIRQLMVQQGASADQLSQISNDQLKQIFLEKLNSQYSNYNQQ
ncbi:hypothetical protein HZA71_00795 [Candidatus Falkowbacteria bacterium]|nr:hypothetical protein [Candidatus Falkowbacteria bacterium]